WNTALLDALVDFLIEHKAEAGDGGNFPDTVWNQAAQLMALYHVRGAVKSAKACKGKWSQLKEQYVMVNKIKNTSGFAWDDNLGVN
ncbi:hypothetical protein K439DRAFT_1264542, partial [Ramaria rubella]